MRELNSTTASTSCKCKHCKSCAFLFCQINISSCQQAYIHDELTHCGLVISYGIGDLGQHQWLGTNQARSHYLKQCCLTVNWTPRNKIWLISFKSLYTNGLVQEICNSIANTLELHLSRTNPIKSFKQIECRTNLGHVNNPVRKSALWLPSIAYLFQFPSHTFLNQCHLDLWHHMVSCGRKNELTLDACYFFHWSAQYNDEVKCMM